MACRCEKHGWTVTGQTVAEVELGIAAVERALKETNGRGRPPGPTQNGKDHQRMQFQQRKEKLATFIEAINTTDELTASNLAERMGCNASSLGGLAVNFNQVLAELGFQRGEVFANKKRGDRRVWRAGPRIQEARVAVEEWEQPEE